jgi:type 1 glutamine amidotransferase
MTLLTSILLISSLISSASLCLHAADMATSSTPKTRLLVVTGGHDFEKAPFFKLFQTDTLTYQAVEHPRAQALFKPAAAIQYDVIVLYDMWQDITEEAKADLVKLLQQGKGLVALHHCLASYQNWPEYEKIIGGKYYLKNEVINGIDVPASTYQHDVDFLVHVVTGHPVTRGLADFKIHDETYGKFGVQSSVQILLTTTEPTSGKTIGWAHEYGRSKVVYLALGHDHLAYENPNFQKLLYQAIAWTAGGKK